MRGCVNQEPNLGGRKITLHYRLRTTCGAKMVVDLVWVEEKEITGEWLPDCNLLLFYKCQNWEGKDESFCLNNYFPTPLVALFLLLIAITDSLLCDAANDDDVGKQNISLFLPKRNQINSAVICNQWRRSSFLNPIMLMRAVLSHCKLVFTNII